MIAWLQISLSEKYATAVFRVIKREEIRKGSWKWPEDISFYDWVLEVAGKEAADLIPKQLPDTLPLDTGVYCDLVTPIKISNRGM